MGYQDRLRDQSNLNVVAGYWVAYYTNSKHPRKPEDVIQRQNMRNAPTSLNKPKPDIETFLRREHRRLAYEQNK